MHNKYLNFLEYHKSDFSLFYSRNIALHKLDFFSFTILILLMLHISISAQPSGGPYGPATKNYELPKTKGKIYFVSPDGNPSSLGESIDSPTTIETAIAKVITGDAIVMRGGTYRTGNLILNQGIIIQPYLDEMPVLKGTMAVDKWEKIDNGLWTTKWNKLFPSKPADWWRSNREGRKTPLHKFNNDMVFINGKFLQSAGWQGEVDENSFYIDYESGTIYIGVDPANKLVEITAYDIALLRTTQPAHGKLSDGKGSLIQGITFTQYAYRAIEIEGTEPEGISEEKNHGKEVIGMIFENCTISYCSRVAGYFRGDKLIIRNCKISDTSTEGIYIIASSDVLLEKNIFMRNNIEKITGYYPAAVKIFNQSYRVKCNDNLVIDLPYSNGIWYDVGNVDGIFTNNWIQDVGNNSTELNIDQPWPSDNGFFFEISKGAVCAGNVFVNCDHGIWILNSSNVQVYNNTFINSTACISRNERSAAGDHFGWHPSTGPDVDEREGHVFVNNLMYGSEGFSRPLLYIWQPVSLCEKLKTSQLKELDYNLFIRSCEAENLPLIYLSPASNNKCRDTLSSLNEMNKHYPGYFNYSKYLRNYKGPLFKSFELGNFEIIEKFKSAQAGKLIPFQVTNLLNNKGKYIGAFPSGKQ